MLSLSTKTVRPTLQRSLRCMSTKLEAFGDNVFPAFDAEAGEVSAADADKYAQELLKWSQDRGATHFTHLFQPLTDAVSEKHDGLFKEKNGSAVAALKGKTLTIGEPDGSSFPNGGLRVTHEARGYTVWDPSSPPYVLDHGTGSTLYIPSMFFSWSGKALDTKIPLLRSEKALTTAGKKLFKSLRMPEPKQFKSDCGIEQEFFLIDRDYYLKRDDLVATGRTLQGAAPAKGQSLDDQYFGAMSHRYLDAIHDAEERMWALGIPQSTRHREVAPGQYEIAPVFKSANVAIDQNMAVQRLLSEASRDHELACLLHEKPFADLNGSGKHNNWSVGTDTIGTLFNPGDDIPNNRLFLVFCIATIRAVHLHADLLRVSVASAGNDHRLGGHEAPPAIISIFLGDDVTAGLKAFAEKTVSTARGESKLDLGVPLFPEFKIAATDRNRTSPVAFTGNKFEFRAVGSDQNVAHSTTVLNTILADSMDFLSAELESRTEGMSEADFNTAVDELLTETLNKHSAVLFDGDNYSQEWAEEAARRGLPNLVTTPDALATLSDAKNVDLFESTGVLAKDELLARQAVFYDNYTTTLVNEGNCLLNMYNRYALPAGVKTQVEVAGALAATSAAGVAAGALGTTFLPRLSSTLDRSVTAADELAAAVATVGSLEGSAAAEAARDAIRPGLVALRAEADSIEATSSSWPLPSYLDMLFHQD